MFTALSIRKCLVEEKRKVKLNLIKRGGRSTSNSNPLSKFEKSVCNAMPRTRRTEKHKEDQIRGS